VANKIPSPQWSSQVHEYTGTNEIGIFDDLKRDGSSASMPADGHGGDIEEDAKANGGQEDCSDEEDDEDKENIQQTSAVLPGVAKLPHSERDKFAGALLTLTAIATKRNCAYFGPFHRPWNRCYRSTYHISQLTMLTHLPIQVMGDRVHLCSIMSSKLVDWLPRENNPIVSDS